MLYFNSNIKIIPIYAVELIDQDQLLYFRSDMVEIDMSLKLTRIIQVLALYRCETSKSLDIGFYFKGFVTK